MSTDVDAGRSYAVQLVSHFNKMNETLMLKVDQKMIVQLFNSASQQLGSASGSSGCRLESQQADHLS